VAAGLVLCAVVVGLAGSRFLRKEDPGPKVDTGAEMLASTDSDADDAADLHKDAELNSFVERGNTYYAKKD
jgi:hypothetical protein